jgi:hypothetical protein
MAQPDPLLLTTPLSLVTAALVAVTVIAGAWMVARRFGRRKLLPPRPPLETNRHIAEPVEPSTDVAVLELPPTPRPAGRKSVTVDAGDPCPRCGRHVGASRASCPHCYWSYTERNEGSAQESRPLDIFRGEYDE